MPEPSPKIVITPSDLTAAPLVSDRSFGPPPNDRGDDRPAVNLHRPRLILLSLIPLVNVWSWWPNIQSEDNRIRQAARIGVFVSTTWSLLVAIGLAGYVFSPHPTWLVQLARAASYGVVRLQTSQGVGTGVVIASRGNRHLILTNRHVISVRGGFFFFTFESPEDPCGVILRSGESKSGHLAAVPKDKQIDLALILVESTSLKTLGKVRRFENVQQGEPVAALGHPLGELDFSITEGIVSAKREGMFVQTSAPINHGNSGGPLVDERGSIVGVNSFIVRDDNAEGLGFAIRADYVLRTANWEFSKKVNVTDLMAQLTH